MVGSEGFCGKLPIFNEAEEPSKVTLGRGPAKGRQEASPEPRGLRSRRNLGRESKVRGVV